MSTRERIMAVYRGQQPDRPACGIYNSYLRYGTVGRRARALGMGILHFEPVISLLAPPWHIKPGYVSEVKGATLDVRIHWDKGERIETRTFSTPVGSVTQVIGQDPVYGSDWIKRHYICEPDDYRVMQYVVENSVFAAREGTVRARMRDLGEDGVVLGRLDRVPYQKLLIELAGPERLMLDLYDNPDPILELMAAMAERLDEQFLQALDSDVDVIWQPDNVTSGMTPPRVFERHVQPIYERRGELCRQAGKVYAVHLDGRLGGLKHHIAACPFDVVESFSFREMAGDVTVSEAHTIWPDKVLCPNFPASLAERPQDEIEEFLAGVHSEMAGEPYMMQISEDIPPGSYGYLVPILSQAMLAL